MKRKDQLKSHLFLDYVLQHQPEVILQLIADPADVLKRLQLDEDALKCPKEVHEAYERGKSVAEEVEALGEISLSEALPRIARIARLRLGDDLTAAKLPFGLRFSEKVSKAQRMDWTATATFECVFGPGCHADVDG